MKIAEVVSNFLSGKTSYILFMTCTYRIYFEKLLILVATVYTVKHMWK